MRKFAAMVADGLVAAGEDAEDLAAGGIGDGPEDSVLLPAIHGNHMVSINVTKWFPTVKDFCWDGSCGVECQGARAAE